MSLFDRKIYKGFLKVFIPVFPLISTTGAYLISKLYETVPKRPALISIKSNN